MTIRKMQTATFNTEGTAKTVVGEGPSTTFIANEFWQSAGTPCRRYSPFDEYEEELPTEEPSLKSDAAK